MFSYGCHKDYCIYHCAFIWLQQRSLYCSHTIMVFSSGFYRKTLVLLSCRWRVCCQVCCALSYHHEIFLCLRQRLFCCCHTVLTFSSDYYYKSDFIVSFQGIVTFSSCYHKNCCTVVTPSWIFPLVANETVVVLSHTVSVIPSFSGCYKDCWLLSRHFPLVAIVTLLPP